MKSGSLSKKTVFLPLATMKGWRFSVVLHSKNMSYRFQAKTTQID